MMGDYSKAPCFARVRERGPHRPPLGATFGRAVRDGRRSCSGSLFSAPLGPGFCQRGGPAI